MSRGAHAGHRKPRRRRGASIRIVLTVLGVIGGLALCAAVGWTVVAVTIGVGVLAGAGASAVVLLVVALTCLTISRRRTRAAPASHE